MYHISMTTDPAAIPVVHNATARRFEITLDSKTAYSKYLLAGGKIIIDHTEVPEELEGRGLASRIVSAALDYARAQNLKVLPICPFAKSYIGRHLEYQDLLASHGQ
jgi:predicted GNAT family acetyltransferase